MRGTSYVAADGSLDFGNPSAPQGTGGQFALGGVITATGDDVDFELAGDGSLVVRGFPVADARGRLTDTSLELGGGITVPGATGQPPVVSVRLDGAACLGPCPAIIAGTDRAGAGRLSVRLAGDATLNVSGFEVKGVAPTGPASAAAGAVLEVVATSATGTRAGFSFNGSIDTAQLAASVSGQFSLAAGRVAICAEGQGRLKKEGTDPSGTVSFCTSPLKASVDLTLPYDDGTNRTTFRFRGDLTARSADIETGLDGDIVVLDWHSPARGSTSAATGWSTGCRPGCGS